jgi:hypothetical protein
MIPPAIPPKHGRGQPRKIPPEVIVFLQDDEIEAEEIGDIYLLNDV